MPSSSDVNIESVKDELKVVAEELKLTVPDNAKVFDLKILIESSEVKKETELVKNIIDYAVEETRIKKPVKELNLELEKIKLAHKWSESETNLQLEKN
ncbi:nucleic-acid-binding protein from transposon X-element [Trichonephila clavipes]|nr:nucleic-acid-binding protein from transposon X-element [Trichonephila clavipes]